MTPQDKKALSERDICSKFISPALKRAGWDDMTQVREEVPMAFVESVPVGPSIGEMPTQWRQGMRWNEVDHAGFEFLGTVVSGTLRDLEKVASNLLHQLVGLVSEQKQFTPVIWLKEAHDAGSSFGFRFPQISVEAQIAAEMSPPLPSGTGAISSLPLPSGSINLDRFDPE